MSQNRICKIFQTGQLLLDAKSPQWLYLLDCPHVGYAPAKQEKRTRLCCVLFNDCPLQHKPIHENIWVKTLIILKSKKSTGAMLQGALAEITPIKDRNLFRQAYGLFVKRRRYLLQWFHVDHAPLKHTGLLCFARWLRQGLAASGVLWSMETVVKVNGRLMDVFAFLRIYSGVVIISSGTRC